MDEREKKLLQAKHRLEEAQARDRVRTQGADAAAYPEGRDCRKRNAGDKFHDAGRVVALFAGLVSSAF